MMSVREAYNRVVRFQCADFIPNFDMGPINEALLAAWKTQGMPKDATFDRYFGLHHRESNAWSIVFGPIPGVAAQGVVEETSDKVVERDAWGGLTERPKGGDMAEGAWHAIRHGIESREDWGRLRGHFRADEPKRYPDHWDEDNWEQKKARWAKRTTPLVQWGPSLVGRIKEVMGFENFAIALHEDFALVEEIMETFTQLGLDILGRAFDEVDFDCFHFWEDIAFNQGPILSPEMFEALAVPRYKRLTDFWRSKGGEIASVDSDGDIRKLIPGWLRGGINHFWPMEANAGMDVVALRREYGRAFSMEGGINKYELLKGREAIDRELDRVAPVVQGGGYIPFLDHQIPNGVTFDNYCYYMEGKKKLLGL